LNDNNFLKEIGRSYIVSAFLPAGIFVLLGYFLFSGFIPNKFLAQNASNPILANINWVILTFITLWVAFYLYSASDITVRFFEGYLFPKWFQKILIGLQKVTVRKCHLKSYYAWKEIEAKISSGIPLEDSENKNHNRNFPKAQEEIANAGHYYPLDEDAVMPTKLGNVFRANELYALERYSIPDVTMWPRLLPLLPSEITTILEERNNQFMFLINSAFLILLNAAISLFFGALGMIVFLPSLPFHKYVLNKAGFFYIGYDNIPPLGYLFISIILFGFGYILYRIATNSARELSMYMRSSYDLYRKAILRQMDWKPPQTLELEKELWKDITAYLIQAERLGKIELPEYEYVGEETMAKLVKPKKEKEKWPAR
jgi:hypothetical protein